MSQQPGRAGLKPVPAELKVTSTAGTTQHIIGERIRQLRGVRGWSVQQVADRCSHPLLTRSAIAKIESGRRMFVTFDELDALAEAFGLGRSEFLPGHQWPDAASAAM